MSSGRQSSHFDDSGGIHGHFRNSCNGIIRRYKNGDYNYLTKVGAGLLLGFGCYKLYQQYDPAFYISDYVPYYITSAIPTIPLSIILREFAYSANASGETKSSQQRSNSEQETTNFSILSPVEDKEITFQEMGRRYEASHTPSLKATVERGSRQPEQQYRTFTEPAYNAPQPEYPQHRHEDVYVANPQPNPPPSEPTIKTGNVYKNIGKLKVHKINEVTKIEADPNASEMKVDTQSHFEEIGEAEIIDENTERIVRRT